MFDGVVDGFLGDSIQVRRKNIIPDQNRLEAFKAAFDAEYFLYMRRQFLQRGHQAVGFKFHRRKTARELARV